jgi:16S rRNA (cytidine1402-2'-O)-methyltransferase
MTDSRKRDAVKSDPKQSVDGSKPDFAEGPAAAEQGPLPAGLYVVATPIGNLGDVTLRALDVLRRADALYCEDTRVTGKLLAAYEIDAELHSYHDHNAERVRPQIIERLKAGESVALTSDAGTPLISDPGFKLVREARESGLTVTAIPGPSAVLTALAISGLPTDRFCFIGFLPPKSAARRRLLAEVIRLDMTLVLFETGPRLAAALRDLADILGRRDAVITRELTKLHEEVRSASLTDLAAHYAEADAPKGEITIVIAPPGPQRQPVDLDDELRRSLALMSLRDAVAEVSAVTGLPRRQVYARALALAPSAGKLGGTP